MSMTAIHSGRPASLSKVLDAIAPKVTGRDPLGLFSGFQAYTLYTALDAKSDAELAGIGLTRQDLPRVAAADILQR